MRLTRLRIAASVAIAGLFAFGAAVARCTERIVEATVAFVLTAFPVQPRRVDFAPAPVLARTIGLPQTRAFARRRIDRPDSRSRAPDSMAFVTA